STLRQVEDALVNSQIDFSSRERQQFLANVTLWSWQDPDVIKPIPALGTYDDALALYGNPDPDTGFPRYGFPFMRWEEVQSFNDGDDANGIHDRGYQLEPRSPVNVNTASRELIRALLVGLEGWNLFEGPVELFQSTEGYAAYLHLGLQTIFQQGTSNFKYEYLTRDMTGFASRANYFRLDLPYGQESFTHVTIPYARLRNTKIPDLDPNNGDGDPIFSAILANDLYERIHGLGIYTGNPNPIENWREFKFYLDTIIASAKAGELPELAIEDPFANDESEALWSYDREGDFQYFNEYYRDLILANFDPNTMSNDFNPDLVVYRHTDKADLITYSTEFSFEPTGVFHIWSEGCIQNSTEDQILATSNIESVVKLFEFMRLTTQQQLVGKNTAIADISDRFGINDSASATKWDNTVNNSLPDYGSMLMSHPEPYMAALADPLEYIKANVFDGRIGLSPVKHQTAQTGFGASLWSYYEGSINANDSSGSVPPESYSEPGDIWGYDNMYGDTIAEEVIEDRLMRPHTLSGKSGTLFADGVFSEAWKCPAYPPEGHLKDYKGLTGSAMLIIKPNFMMKDSNRCRTFLNLGQGSMGG
ncbi:hypothetical protein ACFL54_06825, partial [Planctomycetota bacterium]